MSATAHNAAFLPREALESLGFAQLGNNVRIHTSCVMVGCESISIGDNVRIDPFTVLTANQPMAIGSHVHISSHVSLVGGHGITIGDFACVSHGAKVFSVSDDYSGAALIGAQVPAEFRSLSQASIRIGAHACLGVSSIILPGGELGEGSTVGALSLVAEAISPWSFVAGIPARHIRIRDKDEVLRKVAAFLISVDDRR